MQTMCFFKRRKGRKMVLVTRITTPLALRRPFRWCSIKEEQAQWELPYPHNVRGPEFTCGQTLVDSGPMTLLGWGRQGNLKIVTML